MTVVSAAQYGKHPEADQKRTSDAVIAKPTDVIIAAAFPAINNVKEPGLTLSAQANCVSFVICLLIPISFHMG